MQKAEAVNTAKHLRHVPYKTALQQHRLFSLNHRRIRVDPITMFRIANSLLEFTTESILTNPTYPLLLGVRFVPINLMLRR